MIYLILITYSEIVHPQIWLHIFNFLFVISLLIRLEKIFLFRI